MQIILLTFVLFCFVFCPGVHKQDNMSRKWSAMTFICIICPMSYVLLNILASVAGMCIVYVGLNILESDFVQRVAAPGLAPQNYEINLKKELKHVKRVRVHSLMYV